jgi:L-threonylcarbamoyladenylate synthase
VTITARDAETFERCIHVGGVAVFPADTVYGLACDPTTREAVERLYALKGRRPDKPAAVMFFDLELAFAALPELGDRTKSLLMRLMPGGLTALLPNPRRRYPLACGVGGDGLNTLGLRVPNLGTALSTVRWPVLQSSANHAGGADARRLEDVPEAIRRDADLVLDGGELPGTPSTVVDLRRYEDAGEWSVLREGAVPAAEVAAAAS